jgi:hypothetical protein
MVSPRTVETRAACAAERAWLTHRQLLHLQAVIKHSLEPRHPHALADSGAILDGIAGLAVCF